MSVTAVDQGHTFFTSDHWSADISTEPPKDRAEKKGELTMFAEEEPSFWDFLDVINPLQHIPLVNTLYREATGDQIGVGARLAGGALFGGPIGLAASMVNCVIEEETGKDVGGHMLAMFGDDEPAAPGDPAPTQVAMAAPAPTPTAPAAAPEAEADEEPMPDMTGAMAFTIDGPVEPLPAAPAMAAAAPIQARPMPLTGAQPARFMP
ncbi:MAG TPA: hypothetical protein VLL76_00555, partial [Candidatus Omnitrophota bacterium]|nr:hypothetical protein [Candidatus Omnitrophota bacterium]